MTYGANPQDLFEPQGFAHVSIATGSKQVHVAGQVAQDRDGNVVGKGDLAAQTARAIENVVTALAAAGAIYADVVNVIMYVPDWHESNGHRDGPGDRVCDLNR